MGTDRESKITDEDRRQLNMSMEQSIITTLVEAVADVEDVEPTDVDYTLQEYIEVDAINQLATHENDSWKLSFELPDHHVTVTGDGSVFVNNDKR